MYDIVNFMYLSGALQSSAWDIASDLSLQSETISIIGTAPELETAHRSVVVILLATVGMIAERQRPMASPVPIETTHIMNSGDTVRTRPNCSGVTVTTKVNAGSSAVHTTLLNPVRTDSVITPRLSSSAPRPTSSAILAEATPVVASRLGTRSIFARLGCRRTYCDLRASTWRGGIGAVVPAAASQPY